jgi:hypothetical protein
MLGLRSECAWGKLQYKETRSAVERMTWYFINKNRVNRIAMCLKFTHVWNYVNFRQATTGVLFLIIHCHSTTEHCASLAAEVIKQANSMQKSPSWKANSASASQEFPNFKEPGGSSPCSQEPATCPYAEPYQSNPDILSHCLMIHFYVTSYSHRSSKLSRFLRFCHQYSYCYVCPVLGILFSLCRSVYCLCVNVYCTTATGWQPNCS